jgi:hypothetical protein
MKYTLLFCFHDIPLLYKRNIPFFSVFMIFLEEEQKNTKGLIRSYNLKKNRKLPKG